MSFLRHHPPYILREGLSPSPSSTNSAGWPLSPRGCPISGSLALGLWTHTTTSNFLCGCWRLRSSSWMAGCLSTKIASLSPQPAFPFPSSRLTQMNTLTLETKGVKMAEPPNAKDQESEISSEGKWPPAQTKTAPFRNLWKQKTLRLC